jgi:PAS domain S-box-containing protein
MKLVTPRIFEKLKFQAHQGRARGSFLRNACALTVVLGILSYLVLSLRMAADAGAPVLALATFAAIITAVGYVLLVPALRRNRQLAGEIVELETRIEALSDRQWESREAEERIRSLLDAQGDVIVRRDARGLITYANDAFCALAGQSITELLGTRADLDTLKLGAMSVLPDGTRAYDQEITSPSGPRWISWHEVSVRSDDSLHTETQSVGRDVTARVQAERALAEARQKAEAANHAKGRFLAMVSHEIRTPLNGILGMADLLRDTELSAEQRTYVQAVRTSGDMLLSLIEEILDFSKIEAGKLDLEKKPLDLEQLVEATVELLAPRAQAKNIEIASFVDDDLPSKVIGDAARIRQVLLNLAGNAVKFTAAGGVSIVVERGSKPDEIAFSVQDTGIGIPPNAQARIFEEFEQAEGGADRKFGGTGLGLSISRRIVEGMNGTLNVISAPNEGSTFTFTVKLPGAGAEATFAPPQLDDAHILIASPNKTESNLLARRLIGWGAHVRIACDAGETRELLGRAVWNSVIADAAFGFELTAGIAREAKSGLQRIVLVTPSGRGDLASYKDEGFSAYLIKPVRAASLAARFGRAHNNIDDFVCENVPTTALPSGGLSILVAEDNDINALLARALLERLGHRPTIVANGAAAIESFNAARKTSSPYDLVLMDVYMPEVDGMSATRTIRSHEVTGGIARTPIIALTATVTAEDREACLKAGMDGFLSKPLEREQLITVLANLTSAVRAA